MKTIFALALVLMLSFCAFAEEAAVDFSTMTIEELEAYRMEFNAEMDAAIAAARKQESEQAADELDAKTVQLEMGDSISLGSIDLTLMSAHITDVFFPEYTTDIYMSSNENCLLAYLNCLSANSFEDFSALSGKASMSFIIDGEHEFTAKFDEIAYMYELLEMNVPESEADRFWFFSNIPNEHLAYFDPHYNTFTFRIYYRNASSDTDITAENCDAIYELDMTAGLESEINDPETIWRVQSYLNEVGYNCGTPDGKIGKNTADAISAFQAEYGVEVTGTVTLEILQMFRMLN